LQLQRSGSCVVAANSHGLTLAGEAHVAHARTTRDDPGARLVQRGAASRALLQP
jgi:hypothetical protein